MVDEPKPMLTEQIGAAINATQVLNLLSSETRTRFSAKLGLNAHAIVEAVLHETCQESADLNAVWTDASEISRPARGTALGLALQNLHEVTIFRCIPLINPERVGFGFRPEGSTETWLVGVTIDDVEYIIHPADIVLSEGIVISSLGPESHLGRTSLYIRRIITDRLREVNPTWDPVAFPLWLRAVPDNAPVYYKAVERVPVTLGSRNS